MQCAHIISRVYTQTRTNEDNAFCLCASCHYRFGKWPVDFAEFVYENLGKDKYNELKQLALSGRGQSFDWDAEVVRLKTLLEKLQE